MSGKLNLKVVLASAAVAGAAMAVQSAGVRAATTYNWVPTTGGSYAWDTASNWNPSGVPNAVSDGAYLTGGLSGNQTISLGQAISLNNLVLGSTTTGGDGSNTYTIGGSSGNTLTLSPTLSGANPTTGITENVGSAGDIINSPITVDTGAAYNNLLVTNSSASTLTLAGKLTMTAGSSQNNLYYNTGSGADATSSLILTGMGSQIQQLQAAAGTVYLSSGTLGISYSGNNAITIYNGAALVVDGGAVTTTGNLQVNLAGSGTMTVSSGSLVPTENNGIYLASSGTATTGTLNVTGGVLGNSSNLANSYSLNMGGNGSSVTTANVNVSGGQVYLYQVYMGTNGPTGTSSTMSQSSGTVDVGNTVQVGGSDAAATLTVSGGTFSSATQIAVGTGGTLNIRGTGSVNLPAGSLLNLNSGGVINLSGGTLTTAQFTGAPGYIAGTFNFTGGTLAMYNPSNSTSITTAGDAGTFTNSGGTLAVGGEGTTGATYIYGNYDQTLGTLAINIGGTGQGANTNGYSQLNTTASATGSGLVTLGGDLAVNLVDGFTPSSANIFTILYSNGLSGAFSNVAVGGRIDVANGPGSFELLQSGNNLFLANFAVPEPAALGFLMVGAFGILLLGKRPKAV